MKTDNCTYKFLIFSLLTMMLLLPSCSKDDNKQLTNIELLTLSGWRVTAYIIEPGFQTYDNNGKDTGISNDYFAIMGDCLKDNIRTFNIDKSLIIVEGTIKCMDEAPQKSTGAWSFNSDETILTYTEWGYTQVCTVVELTRNVLKVKWTETFGGNTSTITITFQH